LRIFSFRLGKGDKDIERLLEGIDGKERSGYIKNALRFYRDFGEKLDRMEALLEKIGSREGSFSACQKEEVPENFNGQAEKMLMESLSDILSF